MGRIRFKTFRFNLMIEDVRCEQKLHELFVNFVAMVFFHGLHCRQCCKTFTLLRPLATSTPTAFCALHGRGLHDMAKMRSIFFNGWRLFLGKKDLPQNNGIPLFSKACELVMLEIDVTKAFLAGAETSYGGCTAKRARFLLKATSEQNEDGRCWQFFKADLDSSVGGSNT